MLPSRGILASASPNNNNTTTTNNNNNSLQQQINAGNFATACYNNARTPFAIHEILGLASAATQMPNMAGANLLNASTTNCSRLSSFENNAAAAAAYFMPQSYYQASFLDPNLSASMNLSQSSCQSQLFPQLDMNPASFITANMSNLDYNNGNLEIKFLKIKNF